MHFGGQTVVGVIVSPSRGAAACLVAVLSASDGTRGQLVLLLVTLTPRNLLGLKCLGLYS